MRLVLHEGLGAVSELGEAWQDLEARCFVHPFQTHAFAQAWCDTACATAHTRPVVATLEDQGRLSALFPANIARYGPVRLIDWLGGPYIPDFGDILYDAESASMTADEFVSASLKLLQRHHPMAIAYLSNVRSDAVAYPELKRRMTVYKTSAAPFLPLDVSFDEVLASLSRNNRHNYERHRRRLEEAGDVNFRVVRSGDPEFTVSTRSPARACTGRGSTSPAQHSGCWVTASGRSTRSSPRDGSGVEIASLELDGEPIALSYECVYGNRLISLVSAYDPEYARFSPSVQLKGLVIEDCIRQGIELYDFGWGTQSYKLAWTNHEMPLTTFVSSGPGGRLLVAAANARRRMGRGGPHRPFGSSATPRRRPRQLAGTPARPPGRTACRSAS